MLIKEYNTELDKQCTYKQNIEARSRKHWCHAKTIHITYSECVSVALVIQHAKCMCYVLFVSTACPTLPYFPTLSHKLYDFKKKKKLFNIK